MARAGRRVAVFEAEDTLGGGVRSAELTLPGFLHDVCSSVHPLVPGSPFFRQLPLGEHGLEMIHPPYPLAHPFDDGSAVLVSRSLDETAAGLGVDEDAYRKLLRPIVDGWGDLEDALLAPLVAAPKHPVALARFGLRAIRSAAGLARARFETDRARALLGGCAAHSMVPLEQSPTGAFGVVLLASAHLFGWPFPRGGAQKIADAMLSLLARLGGSAYPGEAVDSVDDLDSETVLCDVVPMELARIAGRRLPARYAAALRRFPHGPGAFKVDFALDGPIPWKAPECAQAGTVHLGGTLDEIAESERAPWQGRHAQRPFVLLAQHSRFDETRAPAGKDTAWTYCHVPNGSAVDMTARIEAQIERFAPGFRELVLGRSVMGPAVLESHNRNLVGGDLNAGAATFWRLIARPAPRPVPYRTPAEGVYLCSASTPPGGGVHGMCGYLAGRAALRDAL